MDAILRSMYSPSFVNLLRWEARNKLTNKTRQSHDEMIAEFIAASTMEDV
jgi:hypothetical protein